jgi:predicted transcriptional regulator
MQSREFNTLGPCEEEFVETLTKIGLSKNVAKIFVYLTIVKEATSREIELGADLRQPDVSLAMRTLEGQKWIMNRKIRRSGKRGPFRIYRLAYPAHEIIDKIEREKHNDIEMQIALIDRMREIIATL